MLPRLVSLPNFSNPHLSPILDDDFPFGVWICSIICLDLNVRLPAKQKMALETTQISEPGRLTLRNACGWPLHKPIPSGPFHLDLFRRNMSQASVRSMTSNVVLFSLACMVTAAFEIH